MGRQRVVLSSLAVGLVLVLACASDPADPVSPSGGAGGTSASTETLKVGAPTPISPVNDQQPSFVILTASAALPKFVAPVPLQYNFEVYNNANVRVVNDTVSGPSDTVTTPLNVGQRYTWRVRATLNGAFGPFSTAASFIAPAGGYNIAGELYDPLINGRTIGTAHGSVDFLPGVGLRLNNRTSYVDYQLPATIDSGEISAVITNISSAPGQVGLKTRVFSMSQGFANMTDNARRFTIEKRNGAEAGAIAWRVITSGNQIETDSPAARLVVNFSPSQSYLFRATWGSGRFNLTIDQVGGGRLYEKGKVYLGSYNPTPHIAFLGAPDSTSGQDAQTVPGMILRHFWVSNRARPAAITQ